DFLIIYFVSLVLSDVSSVIKHKDNPSYRSVGASGAIAGVLFSFILYAPTSTIMIFPIPFPIPSPIFGLLYLAYSFFAARKQADMINHEAHFWGAVSGMAVTVILEPRVLAHFFNSVF
ncbi:MAG: rhomboid family intramembrane serine protease, partial [Bacteroidota bacterium]